MMTMQQNREASGDQELVLHYSDVDGRFGRIFWVFFFGGLAAVGLMMLSSLVVDRENAFDEVGPLGIVGLAVVGSTNTLMFGPIAVRMAVVGRRSVRGAWWLRLSSTGFEVNDRLVKPRRYDWRDIDKFMLVAPSADIADAVVAPGKTGAEVFTHGGTQNPVLRVGFHWSSGHRATLANKLFASMSGLRGRDGTKSHGLVMGYWDRPFDEAVDLMNEWLTRYKTA
jgi:hypothetical protein